jgi:hypothetical protein
MGKTIGFGRRVIGVVSVVWRARRLGCLVLRIRIRHGRRLCGKCKVDDSLFAYNITTESMRNGFLS